jgi:hypothetical protein
MIRLDNQNNDNNIKPQGTCGKLFGKIAFRLRILFLFCGYQGCACDGTISETLNNAVECSRQFAVLLGRLIKQRRLNAFGACFQVAGVNPDEPDQDAFADKSLQ